MTQDSGNWNVASGRLSEEDYRQNFQDVRPPYTPHQAAVEADRCYFCHDAPCVTACPTGIDVPMFIRQIATGNVDGSARTILNSNILGGMCARVCPTETLCEEACVRNLAEDQPVAIGRLQRHAVDALLETGDHPFVRAALTGKKVAVVGAGPAGLACAHALAVQGHDVDLLDGGAKPGGLNEFGIAAYKTVDNFAQREVAWILSIGGITLKSGVRLGTDCSLAQLRKNYDAVFLGLGLPTANALNLEGKDLEGVADAIGFIADLRQAQDLSTIPIGRRVVVIGGGMTAIDAAAQSKLLGAEEVTMVYRGGPARLKASEHEQQFVQTRGVLIRHWAQPQRLIGENGRLTEVEFVSTRPEDAGDSGVPAGETFTLAADMLFQAIGQSFDSSAFGDADPPDLSDGRIGVDSDRQTSLPDVWAGGDCVAGGDDLTVSAVEDGKVAAASIHRFLSEDSHG